MKTIHVDQDIVTYLVSKAATSGEPLSGILRRELHIPPPPSAVEVDDDVYDYLVARTVDFGESASRVLRRELRLAAPPPSPEPGQGHEPATVEFHIPANTGGTPWNTPDRPVVAVVGDTLRIVNDDSVPHRLHTGGVPFPHPADSILPGEWAQFVLQAPFDPASGEALYDHGYGVGAAFWLKVTAR
jgi:hypothetical protein